MAYVRKTRDRWDIETKWGSEWSVECSEYTWAEARETFKCYRENWHGENGLRLVHRREKIV